MNPLIENLAKLRTLQRMQFVPTTELFRPPSLTSQPRPTPPQAPLREHADAVLPPSSSFVQPRATTHA